MSESLIPKSEIMRLLAENSGNAFAHTTYKEESLRFHLLMQGDIRAVEESDRMCDPDMQGTLSLDPIRNARYLFIVNTGLATRYCIEAGVPQERVYAASDLYIQKADVTDSIADIRALNREFWKHAVELVRDSQNARHYSKPIMVCLDYIDSHFTTKITLRDLAGETDLHPAYLAVLFRKEVGEPFGSYLGRRRTDTARALLTRTEYSYAKIAYSLGYCSQSHFIKSFRGACGLTPHQYRMRFYNANISVHTQVVMEK